MRFKLSLLFIFVALIAVGLCVDFLVVAVWVGGFPLQVDLEDGSARQIVKVSAQVLSNKDWAKDLQDEAHRRDLTFADVAWQPGQPFTVQVRTSGHRSFLAGRELEYYQYRLLALLVEFADGTTQFVTAEIPDGRVQRQLTVTIP